MLGLTLLTFAGDRAHADTLEPDLKGQKMSMDKDGSLRLELAASLNAPVAKVYAALTNPDKLSKYAAEVTSVKVLSSSATGKVVEYHGETDLNPNKKPFVVKFTFDPGKQSITAQSAAQAAIKFRADYVLSSSKDGKSTEVSYVSVAADPSKALGMEVPEFIRQSAGIQTFMKTLINAGHYIQDGGK
jgi:uncharacterized protein YndB with AHSA1/START domain